MELSGKLLFGRVAIKTIEIPQKNRNGLILPESAKTAENAWDLYDDHPFQGIVVGVGDQITSCKKGDIVLLKGNTSMQVLLDEGTVYKIINESDILLVRES